MSRIVAAVSIALVAILVVLSAEDVVGFEPKPCNGVNTTYENFDIDICSGFKGDRCEIVACRPFTIKIDFDAPQPFKRIVSYVKHEDNVEYTDACLYGGRCPSDKGGYSRLYWFASILDSRATLVDLEVGVKTSQTGEYIFCYTVPVQIMREADASGANLI